MNLILKLILVIKVFENFPTAIKDKLGLVHGTVRYKLRGTKIAFLARAGTEDMAEIAVVASGSEYNLDLTPLQKNPTIIDVGGHIGAFSVPLAKKLRNNCRILVFEPEKENYSLLLKNIKNNSTKSIIPYNLAISDYNGWGTLSNDTGNTDSYYLSKKRVKSKKCKVNTLPYVLKKNKVKKVDLLKMDIEGSEYKILNNKASRDFITKNVHYIFMEFHNIGKKYNFSYIKKTTKKNFTILHKTKNIVLLENNFYSKNHTNGKF